MVAVLSDHELDKIVGGGGAGMTATPAPLTGSPFRHYRPLRDAADEYVSEAENRHLRVMTGIPEFDHAMRGLAPKELMVVQGYAHSGKTLFVTQMLMHNHDKRIVLFSPDESRVLVLVKLASLVHGVSAETIEELIAAGNDLGRQYVMNTVEHFPHLAVFDDVNAYDQMHRSVDEFAQQHGGEPQVVVFDYADLFASGDTDGNTAGKINGLKAWGKDRDVPLVALHQSSRSAGAGGQKVTISSGAFGGEQQATFVVGVRRRRNELMERRDDLEAKLFTSKERWKVEDQLREVQRELDMHWDTITFNLVKNKRPPSRLVDELDFTLNGDTGAISPFRPPPPPPVASVPSNVSMYDQMRAAREPVVATWEERELF